MWKLLCVSLVTVTIGRGVRLLQPSDDGKALAPFDRSQSAALFVGVRDFPARGLPEVKYAVDDAIDMAWVFALDPRVSLVTPPRVVLALSGAPEKPETQQRLVELQRAGATVTTAQNLPAIIERQVKSVGGGGVLIASFATHGYSSDGASYVVAPDESLATAKLLDIAAIAPRSIILIDACREPQGKRGAPMPLSFLEGLTTSAGQVVISVAGKYAWDDSRLRNGALTAAVIDGLQCKASTDVRGVVTVQTLWMYVEKRLLTWIRRNRDAHALTATEVRMAGQTSSMPLAACSSSMTRVIAPARVGIDGSSLIAFDSGGSLLWRRTVDGVITHAAVADLDLDGYNEVIASTGSRLIAYSPTGDPLWTADTDAPFNYAAGDRMNVVKFVAGNLLRNKRQEIVALSTGGDVSRVTILDPDGRIRGAYFHPGRLIDVTIAARTSHYAPKIIACGVNDALHDMVNLDGQLGTVFMLDPKKVGGEAPPYRGKLGFGTQLWYGYVDARKIERMEIIDHDHDGQRDIALTTPRGNVHIDFDGHIIEADTQFGLVK